MSTRTDGAASPSVGGSEDADGDAAGGASGRNATPPRQRDPSGQAPQAPPPDPPANGSGTGPGPAGSGASGWVQQEIQRRIAARGAGETGRHSRNEGARTAAGGDEGERSDPPADDAPLPDSATAPTRTPRRRSTRVPDPYAPDGMREPDGPFRMPGPAAASAEPGRPGADATAPATPPKQWPPAEGPAGLPRRVPGAGWPLERRVSGDRADDTAGPADDAEPETRIVPALWAAGSNGSRATDVVAPPVRDDDRDDDLDDLDDEDFDDEDFDDEFDDDIASTGDTEVIWRAPGLDEAPVPAPPAQDGAPGPNPHTGVRPRRFAAETTTDVVDTRPDVVEDGRPECPDLDDAPQGKRKRVVLSERRTVAHSVRTVVDVQDPGPVGTMWRSQLVGTQLRISLQVGGVALLGLFLMPALFAAFPSLGEVSVLGLRLPWLLLGFLTYPFLLLLGWWFVGSAERAEQDFMQEVQDR